MRDTKTLESAKVFVWDDTGLEWSSEVFNTDITDPESINYDFSKKIDQLNHDGISAYAVEGSEEVNNSLVIYCVDRDRDYQCVYVTSVNSEEEAEEKVLQSKFANILDYENDEG